MKKFLLAGVLAAAMIAAPAFADQPFRSAKPTALTEQDIAKYAATPEDAAKLREAVQSGKQVVIISPTELEKLKAGQSGDTIQWTIIAVLVGIGIGALLVS